jgi:hypothetical protein
MTTKPCLQLTIIESNLVILNENGIYYNIIKKLLHLM